MADDWSRAEVEATAARYLEMLEMELSGQPFVKADINRSLQPLLNDRSKGAIEFKFGNLSAVMLDLGKPYVAGYKPYANYQQLLADVAADQLEGRPELVALIESVAAKPAAEPSSIDFLQVLVDPPSRDPEMKYWKERPAIPRSVAAVNHLEIEARNRSLGLAGEKFVMEFEHHRLWSAGRKDLADRIEHVAVSKGDGLGYDVLSFHDSGKDRLIEVKTTRLAQMTPFFASKREVDVSDEQSSAYHLYRVFSFEAPKLFIVPGSLRQNFQLDPWSYKARVR